MLPICLLSACCFIYPGGGECDPATFEGSCRDRVTTVNCENVTPVGYGMGVIQRYAVMSHVCISPNACHVTRWGDAVCIASPVEACPRAERGTSRCVSGVVQECRYVDALRPWNDDAPRDFHWVATESACSAERDAGSLADAPSDDVGHPEHAK